MDYKHTIIPIKVKIIKIINSNSIGFGIPTQQNYE
jgi:hypothetical protein